MVNNEKAEVLNRASS